MVDIFSVPISGALPGLIVFGIGGFFAVFGGPEIWQRILTSRNDQEAARSVRTSAIVMFLWGIALVYASLLIRDQLLPDVNPDVAFFEFLGQDVPEWILGLSVVMLLAAIISTADTELFTSSVVVHRRLLKSSQSVLSISTTRIAIIALGAIIFVLAVTTKDLVNVYLPLVYLTFISGMTGVALLFERGSRWSYSISIAVSSALLLYLLQTDNLRSWYPILVLVPTVLPFFFAKRREVIDSSQRTTL